MRRRPKYGQTNLTELMENKNFLKLNGAEKLFLPTILKTDNSFQKTKPNISCDKINSKLPKTQKIESKITCKYSFNPIFLSTIKKSRYEKQFDNDSNSVTPYKENADDTKNLHIFKPNKNCEKPEEANPKSVVTKSYKEHYDLLHVKKFIFQFLENLNSLKRISRQFKAILTPGKDKITLENLCTYSEEIGCPLNSKEMRISMLLLSPKNLKELSIFDFSNIASNSTRQIELKMIKLRGLNFDEMVKTLFENNKNTQKLNEKLLTCLENKKIETNQSEDKDLSEANQAKENRRKGFMLMPEKETLNSIRQNSFSYQYSLLKNKVIKKEEKKRFSGFNFFLKEGKNKDKNNKIESFDVFANQKNQKPFPRAPMIMNCMKNDFDFITKVKLKDKPRIDC